MLDICGLELEYIDMSINANKSVCLRIGQDVCHECKCVYTSDGQELAWSGTMRHLGVYITSAKVFTCCLVYNRFPDTVECMYRTNFILNYGTIT